MDGYQNKTVGEYSGVAPVESGPEAELRESGFYAQCVEFQKRQMVKLVSETVSRLHDIQRRLTEARQAEEAAYRKLGKAHGELLELARLKDGLTSMIVHDLKNPLQGIMAVLEVLGNEEELPRETRGLLGNASQASRDLLEMISTLLDISRLEEGKMKLELKEVDAGELIQYCVEQAMPVALRDKKTLRAEIQEGLPLLRVDTVVLKRIIANLITNALKHTPSGGEIVVGAKAFPGQRHAEISVRDTGEGIPPEYLDKIFDKFVHVESKKMGLPTDKGLGLNFCKLATEAHGGRIWVESQVNKGSTFHIRLPL